MNTNEMLKVIEAILSEDFDAVDFNDVMEVLAQGLFPPEADEALEKFQHYVLRNRR